jgi:hypothetical protein
MNNAQQLLGPDSTQNMPRLPFLSVGRSGKKLIDGAAELSSLETSVQGTFCRTSRHLQTGSAFACGAKLTVDRLSQYLAFVEAELNLQCPAHPQ